MEYSNLSTIRNCIQDAGNKLFGINLKIEERAYQSLERIYEGGVPHVRQVWSSLIYSLPSIHLLFEALGFENFPATTAIKSKIIQPSGQVPNEYWEDRLRSIFCIVDRDTKTYAFTEAGDVVRQTGVLGIESLVTGILESGELATFKLKALKKMGLEIESSYKIKKGRRFMSSNLKLRVANPILKTAAQYCGVSDNGLWDDRLVLLSATAIDVFNVVGKSDSSFGEQQFILYHDGKKIRIAPFGVFGNYQLSESPLPDGSLWIARSNILQPATRFTNEAIESLEDLINSDAKELEFQKFFEHHPEFLLVLGGYARLHPQLVLHEDEGGRLIPDFFLEKINSDFCDICDLKRPSAELIRHQRHRKRFRDAVMEAVSQLTFYRDWFDDRVHRENFFNTYGLKAYRPRVVVIIGRQKSYYDDVERITLEGNLPQWVELRTYDDIVTRAKQWRNLVL